jgi:hypothetical protein
MCAYMLAFPKGVSTQVISSSLSKRHPPIFQLCLLQLFPTTTSVCEFVFFLQVADGNVYAWIVIRIDGDLVLSSSDCYQCMHELFWCLAIRGIFAIDRVKDPKFPWMSLVPMRHCIPYKTDRQTDIDRPQKVEQS